ncbi:MAG: gfo/Idh/MocA family oxidoreductase [Chloroflexi bacterium]|nr:MAG: gfo/Idh/MocA family oxidoreductase [Chloroflexota bacterium]
MGVLLEYAWEQEEESLPREIYVASSPARQKTVSPNFVSIGLIGAGNFAQGTLLPAIKATKAARLHTVVTASGLSAKSVAQRFGFQAAASDPSAIFEAPDIQAVVIATRHDSHAELVQQALRAGKHVFVEKPLAIHSEELREIGETYREVAQRSRGRPPILMVGFNRRFAPATQAVKDFFAACTEPLAIHIRVNAGYLPPDHWLHDPEVGGGRILGEGCHFVDLLMYLAGVEPVEVYAQALPDDSRYRQDNVAVQIRFANGAIGTLHYLANGDKRLGKERIEVFGGGAVAVIDDFRRVTLSRGGKVRRIGRWWSRQDKGHQAELAAFLEAVRSGGPSPIPSDQAVLSTLTTFKVLESLQQGRPVQIRVFTAEAAESAEGFSLDETQRIQRSRR